ncbi:bifunctional hydroxymethylpyrimidine kinase/phosphomethylpyrimidine kinase [Thalassovita sp.]|uniref:bifunctional hydroxymethylpyrimidine kinase/phosphomethylpyrimidine kinase n=1 Tax=Thalassovita sp. TaxID=1979401 RepID=UPI0029DE5859|nr:bifunctional hydroxymethylpyrimidine kinase/phosphomethylpyrimidine kinase [Thalassovita sp.]
MTAPVLLVGGMDSSGGAGVLRDAAAVGQAGGTAMVAVTAVTAQTDRRVMSVHPVPTDVVADQITAAGPVGAVKLGMLCNRAIVDAVADALSQTPLVLDPVIRSSSGHALLDAEGVAAMLSRLMPRTTLLTPNLPELDWLAQAMGCRVERAVTALLGAGCGAVLVKGGHGNDPGVSVDTLFRLDHPPVHYEAPRYPVSLRGTGCQLASTIAAHLARGEALEYAIQAGKDVLTTRFATICQ